MSDKNKHNPPCCPKEIPSKLNSHYNSKQSSTTKITAARLRYNRNLR